MSLDTSIDQVLQPVKKQKKAEESSKMHASGLPRSKDQPCCSACRRRRIRCDRQQPCSNCSRKGIQCVLPSPKSKPLRNESTDLLERLERLENILHGSGDFTDSASPAERSRQIEDDESIINNVHAKRTLLENSDGLDNSEQAYLAEARRSRSSIDKVILGLSNNVPQIETTQLADNKVRSNCIGNGLFGEVLQEISEMQDEVTHYEVLDYESTAFTDSIMSVASVGSPCSDHEFILGFNSTMSSLTGLHPPSNQILDYWALYKQNVDPLVRVLHKPVTEDLFRSASRSPSRISHSTEPILFSVYLAVTISLEPDECQSMLKIEREAAIKRYQFGTQQALSRANFLTTKDTNVVAAFVILITCRRSLISAGEAWMLVGLLIRIAQSLELHKDGSQLGLSPYDTEIRRRIWWQVCLLDICVSEDHGVDPTITQSSFDTMMPQNLDDSDIWSGMTELPTEHEGPTEMIFDLARHEIGATARDIMSISNSQKEPACLNKIMQSETTILMRKEAAIESLRYRLQHKYFRHCNLDSPLHRFTIYVCQMILAKVQLMIHLPPHLRSSSSEHLEENQNTIFCILIDVIRCARRLETQQKTAKFAWLFKPYSQWSALSLLLAKLKKQSSDSVKEDAWIVIDEAWNAWKNQKSIPTVIPVLIQQTQLYRSRNLDQNKQTFSSYNYRPNPASSNLLPDSNTLDTSLSVVTGLENSAVPSSLMFAGQDMNSDSEPIPINTPNTWAATSHQNRDIPDSMFLLDDIIMEDDLKVGLLTD